MTTALANTAHAVRRQLLRAGSVWLMAAAMSHGACTSDGDSDAVEDGRSDGTDSTGDEATDVPAEDGGTCSADEYVCTSGECGRVTSTPMLASTFGGSAGAQTYADAYASCLDYRHRHLADDPGLASSTVLSMGAALRAAIEAIPPDKEIWIAIVHPHFAAAMAALASCPAGGCAVGVALDNINCEMTLNLGTEGCPLYETWTPEFDASVCSP